MPTLPQSSIILIQMPVARSLRNTLRPSMLPYDRLAAFPRIGPTRRALGPHTRIWVVPPDVITYDYFACCTANATSPAT
jgi:hypothetical protein